MTHEDQIWSIEPDPRRRRIVASSPARHARDRAMHRASLPPNAAHPAAACLPASPRSARSPACSACARPTARYYDGPVSDHFDGTRFFDRNGVAAEERAESPATTSGSGIATGTAEMARMGAESLQRPAARARRWAGVAHLLCRPCELLLQTAGLNILIDPVWSERVSPVSFAGPKRVNDPGIAFDALPPIDVVLVSHCHYDHLDVETLSRLHAAHRPRVITPLGNDTIMQEPRSRRSAPRPTTGTIASSSAAASPSRWCRRGTGRRAG